MSRFGSSGGGAPKRPGAGKPVKGYPQARGADDATIDVRKHQKPSAELPPSQEPANEPPTDSTAPVESVEVDTAPPELPVSPQDDAETNGGASPLPPSPAVPNDGPRSASPQTTENHRPSDPSLPDRSEWMDMPEANASALGAENVRVPSDTTVGQTRVYDDNRTGGTDGGAIDEVGNIDVQPNNSQGPFLSFGEKQGSIAGSSRNSRGQARGEAINPIAESAPAESKNVRAQNQGSMPQVVAEPALGSESVDRVPPKVDAPSIPISAANGDGGSAGLMRQSAANSGSVDALPAQSIGWGEFGRGHSGKQIKNRAGQIATILEVKNGTVTARSERGETLPLWQRDAVFVDVNGVPLPASTKTAQRNRAETGASGAENSIARTANLVPKDGDDPSTIVVLEGFKITRELHDYLREIERITGCKFHPKQLKALLAAATATPFARLNGTASQVHRAKYTKTTRRALIAEWQLQTGLKWPRYKKSVKGKGGRILRRANTLLDAHHIIFQIYGGPHSWFNLFPMMSPKQHQKGIHISRQAQILFP